MKPNTRSSESWATSGFFESSVKRGSSLSLSSSSISSERSLIPSSAWGRLHHLGSRAKETPMAWGGGGIYQELFKLIFADAARQLCLRREKSQKLIGESCHSDGRGRST